MSIVRTLKRYLGMDEGVATTTYECAECGSVFESAKRPERVTCMECLSADVKPRD